MQPIRDWKKSVFAATVLFASPVVANEQPEKPADEAYWTSLVESTTPPSATRKRRSHRLTIAPLSLLMGTAAVELDTALGDRVSWQLGGTALLFAGPLRIQPTASAELATGLRFFPLADDRASAGFWLGIGAFSWLPSSSSSFAAGMDATVGYTFVDERAASSVSIGAGARGISLPGWSSLLVFVMPVLHVNVGLAFLDSGGRMRQTR